jgi:PGF-CTERM protein
MKKQKILGTVAVLLLLACLAGVTQVGAKVSAPDEDWSKTFGGTSWDGAVSVQQTSDGGYILAGHTQSYGAGSSDFWLVKTDSNGNEEWNKTFGGPNADGARSVQQTSDGGYILAGRTRSYGAGSDDAWLVKTDSNGNKEWDKTFGGPYEDGAVSVQQTSDGGYILAGWMESCSLGPYNAWLVKADSNGNEEWNKTFGGPYDNEANSVQQTSDGGYILAGERELYDAWLVKTDSNGNEEWGKFFGGPYWDDAKSVQQTSDGGYILAGSTMSYGAGAYDFWLVKTDSNGNKEWNKIFGGPYWDVAYSVQQTSDGGYILAGWTMSYGAGPIDAWLVKTDSNGNEEWNKTFGGPGEDAAHSVQQTSDGGYILAGWTELKGAGAGDVWVIKLEGDTAASTEKGTIPEVPTGEERGIPGFEAAFTIAGLLAVAYILRRYRK